ncbi:hypothetical protein PACTADRAFT_34363 [Pachysolen tannophilus NRRL Y-2460]|uniref:ADP-ribosylation factor-like protein 2 n=1 Tax=Pachysolen tannophilus NRRL Y-2460 TaxID=669874 RepID=A0A1E4TS78_PACTA|nr:hypothetical protein PACTADRAFT_34363 [Pachysolen tannophilus NRRL Y-2460]
MGLISIIRKQKLKDKELRVLMLGLDNSGKTTIVKSLLGQDVKQVSPTMGFNIETVDYHDYIINIWDVGGQSSLRPFWFNYFEKTDSLIWVIDSLSLERLQENFIEFKKILIEDRLIGSNFLILLNKIDLIEDKAKIQQLITKIINLLQLEEIKNHNWKVLPVSAFTGENLHNGIDWIVDEYKSRMNII